MTDKTDSSVGTVFKLTGYKGRERVFKGGVVITPEPTPWEKVRAAWTHAVRYTAPGFDLVNYDAAIELLRKRYPSWTVIYPAKVFDTPFDPRRAKADTEPEVDA
jgi:hypothetical protein